jgi:signal transduction histidine kinase
VTNSASRPDPGPPTVPRDLLLLAHDEGELLARVHRLLVPVVGDDLAVARATDVVPEPSPPRRPVLPSSLSWPPEAMEEERAGWVWFAPGRGGGWTRLGEGETDVPGTARWFAARLGGTPSAGWALLERDPDRPPISPEELDLLREAAVAAGFALVSSALSRRVNDARAAADAAAHRWAALARMNTLLVRSPDYEDTVDAILEGVVPYLADWAVLDVADHRGSIGRRVGRHASRSRAGLLDRLIAAPVEASAATSMPTDGILIPVVTKDALEREADRFDSEGVLALDTRSLALVPLEVGGRALGVLALATAGSGQEYTSDDLALFRSVGQQAALALSSAELFRAAEQARREREEVLAIVSHDLKNPLNIVGFAAALLGNPEIAEDRKRVQLEVIGRAVTQMNELIERLLDAARIDSGRFHVAPAPEPLDELVAEAMGRAEPVAEQGGVRIEGPGLTGMTVLADRDRMLQVFGNLLANAVSFSPREGSVQICLEPGPEDVRVLIRDHGPGMDEKTQSHIFDRFWQARQSGQAGSGLGLSIARGIVDAHGGRIDVDSAPGRGSTFHFTIPLAKPEPEGKTDHPLT